MTWSRMDLHLHTPASADYQDLAATYLAILQRAEERGLDIIAIADHNSVSGIAAMRREIEDLELLEELDRLQPVEANILTEYRRVLSQVLVLPGFEFTAAYGFHILGIFPPETSIRRLEHLLFTLNVPEDQMEMGTTQATDTADVLTAYELINESGGLVIPAHVNEPHGVALQGAKYGGQTKIAYTQSPYIHALEVTDLDDMTRRSTATFFNGSKPEYPRRMHCIQGSDAHRLTHEGARRETDYGTGDRATEVMLPERTFGALMALFASDEFARIRPSIPRDAAALDPIQAAREAGPTITQAFHEQVRSRRSRYRPILKDVVAFANTNGGTIYVGVSVTASQPAIGVPSPEEAAHGLHEAITRSIVPKLDTTVEIASSGGKPVLVVNVPKGTNTPYATDMGQVFVRQDGQTVIALRDEIVQLVREAVGSETDVTRLFGPDRSWTAPRRITDDEDDADDTAVDDLRAADPEPEATEPQTTEPTAPPRRRRRRSQPRVAASESPPDASGSATESLITDEPTERIGAEIIPIQASVPTDAATPDDVPEADANVTPAAENAIATATNDDAAPIVTEKVESPKPRPRRRTRKPPADAEKPLVESEPVAAQVEATHTASAEDTSPAADTNARETFAMPKTGVEILSVEERDGERFYTMRDLGSGRVMENVTRKVARRLWRLALLARETGIPAPETITWEGHLGYSGSIERDGVRRHTLAYRDNGDIRYFYGVSDDGLSDAWRNLVAREGSSG